MVELNNPLPLVSVKLFGIGIELTMEYEKLPPSTNDSRVAINFCVSAEAIAWKWCKRWPSVQS